MTVFMLNRYNAMKYTNISAIPKARALDDIMPNCSGVNLFCIPEMLHAQQMEAIKIKQFVLFQMESNQHKRTRTHYKSGQNDKCYVCHCWNIQIWSVQVVARLDRIILVILQRPILSRQETNQNYGKHSTFRILLKVKANSPDDEMETVVKLVFSQRNYYRRQNNISIA